MKNHYEILGLEPGAGADDIKKAYRKLSLKFHPDKNEGDLYFASMFRQINEAYQVLGDPAKKQAYDRQRTGDQQQSQQQFDLRERELRELEKRARERNLQAQAILDEAERLINHEKTDTSDATTAYRVDNSLKQVVGLKYGLWAVLLLMVYLVSTKQDVPGSGVAGATHQTRVIRGKHKSKKRYHKQQTLPADSLNANLNNLVDTATAHPIAAQDSVN